MMTACDGCGKPVKHGARGAFCKDCRGNHKDQMRLTGKTAESSPYRLQAWKKRQAAFIRRNPVCALCAEPAKVADHWPQERAELVAAGVRDPDVDQFLRPLCLSHHGVRSSRRSVRFSNDPA
jgi:5-methylcytosine-specific restriction protein A